MATLNYVTACSSDDDSIINSEPVVVDESDAVDITEEYEYVDCTLEATNTYSLDLGNVLHPAEGTWIPVTTAGASSTPMVVGSALSVASGELMEVVPEPVGTGQNVVIYDVRCSDSVYAWVELDIITRDWSLYASAFSAGSLTGETTLLWEDDSDWDPAPFAVAGNRVIWQVQPSTSGSKTTEYSHCYVWKSGSTDATAVIESPGRFATKPTLSGDYIVLAPRVREDEGTYYGVTAYTLDDDLSTIAARLVMPKSVKPFRASYIGDRFLISVEASYSSSDLLSQMGTYLGTEDLGFIEIPYEPSEGGCGKDGLYLIKRNSSYYVINTEEQTYSTLYSTDRCIDYGEYPARVGETNDFVTFATVKDASSGYPTSVIVRTFTL